MADTMGHSVERSKTASHIRPSSAAIAVLLVALAPQIFDLVWSVGTTILAFFQGGSVARNPARVLLDDGSALLMALPSLVHGPFGAASKGGLSSEVLLALIYSYPLLAIAALTPFVRLRAPQDYFGGIVLIAIALFALWASSDLQGLRGFSFGAGTAPRMFGVLLVALGVGITLVGLLTDGAPLATYAWRGPLFVMLSIIAFTIMIRPAGLVLSAFVTFMVAAMGTHETRWKETIIVGVVLTAFCSFLFPYGLGLPMQLWPSFLVQ